MTKKSDKEKISSHRYRETIEQKEAEAWLKINSVKLDKPNSFEDAFNTIFAGEEK